MTIGALLSCIGAGLQSLTGAPRLLQAIAQDEVLPALVMLGKTGASGEPTRALVATAAIALCGVLVASVDAVAPIITMCFLMCYAFVNLACALQSLLQSPNWRPRYRYYHWLLSALGVAMCLILMFISGWMYASLAMLFAIVIYYYIQYRGAAKEWGDGLRGLKIQTAKFALQRLEESPPHTKNWRPQVLVLTRIDDTKGTDTSAAWEPHIREGHGGGAAQPRRRVGGRHGAIRSSLGGGSGIAPEEALIQLSGQFKGGKGLMMVCTAIEGAFPACSAEVKAAQAGLRAFMSVAQLEGFAQAIVGPSVEQTLGYLVQGAGLGALKHNTVVLGWPERWRTSQGLRPFAHALQCAAVANHAALVPRNLEAFPRPGERLTGTIDVWWVMHDGGLGLLLAFLLQQDKVWAQCELRVFCIAESDDNSIQLGQDLELFLKLSRIKAGVVVVEMMGSDLEPSVPGRLAALRAELNVSPEVGGDDSVTSRRLHTAIRMNSYLLEYSRDADLVVLNLPGLPSTAEFDELKLHMALVEAMTEGIRRILLVRGGGREVITIFS